MDVRQQQLATVEQEIVLRSLAESAGRRNCRFLEVGSWCGHSAIILAKVAQKFGGHLFCVDWWKGNPGTELADIASEEDIFTLFWQRICAEGLQNVVVPIRGPSTLVAKILRADSFQLVFLDADHRYDRIKKDIGSYAPFVCRHSGILCGHDCEGRAADYDVEFLEAGRDFDYYESVHCGVVSAVSELFPSCSINHSIWSVRATNTRNRWKPTDLTFSGIVDRRQAPPPLIGTSKSYNFLRYGRRVYLVPHGWSDFDVTDEKHRNHPEIRSERTLHKAMKLAQFEPPPRSTPFLVEEGFLGFNIVAFEGIYYAVAQDAGPLDFSQLNAPAFLELTRNAKLFRANSHRIARLNVAIAMLGPRKPWFSNAKGKLLLR